MQLLLPILIFNFIALKWGDVRSILNVQFKRKQQQRIPLQMQPLRQLPGRIHFSLSLSSKVVFRANTNAKIQCRKRPRAALSKYSFEFVYYDGFHKVMMDFSDVAFVVQVISEAMPFRLPLHICSMYIHSVIRFSNQGFVMKLTGFHFGAISKQQLALNDKHIIFHSICVLRRPNKKKRSTFKQKCKRKQINVQRLRNNKSKWN